VGIARILRDFQARRESRFLDFSALRLFHSPLRADGCSLYRRSFRTVAPETLGAMSVVIRFASLAFGDID
jgi:hypothetical protein